MFWDLTLPNNPLFCQWGNVGELHDGIHPSVRIKGLRYIKRALKLAGISTFKQLKGGIDHGWQTTRCNLELQDSL